MKIAIGCDHAGFKLKEAIKGYLVSKGFNILDEGTYSEDSVDYPDFAAKVALDIKNQRADFGILICGTGIGMSIAANRIKGIRAALCLFPEMAKLARSHNNANILVLPGRFIAVELAQWIVDAFIEEKFEGGRHENRVQKIEEMDK
ncbi:MULTISPECIES: ribose 5-phosphate isomerase B [Pseudothermotoga]|uniref:Ribose 5-phosphate isomerase B n=1 Tax=Pseudothermotoga lettingae (strain ATCC BAA-301 / DSM 14385 / NBRC 107922 / TMO) TaxID=416591 RepID=A8F427_PSELT|nr:MULTISPECIES: ribose 5-phosphate isomerase B [Pseudothermotoga]ABV32911.1 ribose 5-phosphate isomerase B [Pseudothermotoga lettingae TMO]KUK21800.1 MAG: Ribose 5-phosphate isomerase B [Pseudothermotoga lettingae]MDI3494023.1 ribose 5-phosphate isomerase [Pseudothermotoga sp.]MDK2884961.1 ribose 5-phosphate isomerase [Pseudothermotoga sp.]GLI48090.1 ribose 5-phosphate isomerase B [Pseudothermotoga lettingae TMO]